MKMRKIFYIIVLIVLTLNYLNGMTYTVKRGDTAYGICRKFGIAYNVLVSSNSGVDLSKLKAGQLLNIPDLNAESNNNARNNSGSSEINSAQIPNFTLKRPVRAKVCRKYGLERNIFEHGVLFIVKRENILSAAKGTVTFAGKISQLGKVVFISHRLGFTTVYNITGGNVKVKTGDCVKLGQIIVENNMRIKLYFQLFKGNKPLNPLRYM